MQTHQRRCLQVLAVTAFLAVFCTQLGAEVLGPGHPARIGMEQVKGMLDHGEKILFVDTRTPSEWQNASDKIPGAIRLTTTNDIVELTRNYPADTIIVTYCT